MDQSHERRLKAGAVSPRGPDFICFGMQRAGTRWLYDQLAAHDDVWMPPVKEIGHFVDDCFKASNTHASTKSPELPAQRRTAAEREAFWRMYTPERRAADPDRWYLGLFEPKAGRLSGDVSPEYAILGKSAVRKVAGLCPDARYLFVIRDPVDRFWSALNLNVRSGRESGEALESWSSVETLVAKRRHDTTMRPTQARYVDTAIARCPSRIVRSSGHFGGMRSTHQ